jgi:FlaA1/EpsC-like NDP-sugar epimerase
MSKRVLLEGFKSTLKLNKEGIRILIIGAGNAGEQIVRDMLRNRKSNYVPVGFIDDAPAKRGVKIHGIKILGQRGDIARIAKSYKIEEILIAIPSVHSSEIKKIVEIVKKSGLETRIKILPDVSDLMNGKVTLSDIHEIELEDLLGRIPVNIDFKVIKNFIQDKKVLITGAGGSIGSELSKSIVQFNPKKLVVLDIDETDITNLFNNLKFGKVEVIPIIGDIRNESKMNEVFKKFLPEIVIHSAAYKHVPVLEFFPDEAVGTNIFGTKILAEKALKYGIEKFIYISTDKAINPTSIMGATKRIGEEIMKIMNQRNTTKFISVRFGNVMGSRGSVIPLFKEQLKRGGPITVTHPEMKRYFMITSEAVLLVLEASAIGIGGDVYILDMGEPIKIIDLAKEMIKLSGYEPDVDIPIVFTQIRPGEKLFEEVLSAEEGAEKTKFEKIFKAKGSGDIESESVMKKINKLIKAASVNDKDEILKLLKEIVPSYNSTTSKFPVYFS